MKDGDGKLKTTFLLAPGMEHSMIDRQASEVRQNKLSSFARNVVFA